jgi:hypothetical protein
MKRTPRKFVDYTDWTVEQHIEHLSTESSYQPFYAQYNSESVERFIKEHAKQKHSLYQKEDYYKEKLESFQTRFLNHAERYIDQILQKKLFNLQCRWRAGQIELPFVDIREDFDYWESNIRACPFIPPITEAEIDLCIRFLLEKIDWGHCNNAYIGDVWQDYEKFKNQLFVDEHEGTPEAEALTGYYCEELPDLYLFFDTYQGTGNLINLPDIRGEIEKVFASEGGKLEYDERVAESKANGTYKEYVPPKYDEEGKPLTDADKPDIYSRESDEFLKQYEDERTKSLYKAHDHHRKYDQDLNYDGLDDDLEVLQEFDEPIPIEACSDWRIAVRIAAARYRQKKAAEMLPYAYDTYLLEFDDEDVDKIIEQRVAHFQYVEKYNTYQHLLYYKEVFLKGREALTGKQDFDYLND